MKLSELGEREIIERLKGFLEIGDDAACVRFGDTFLVMATDTAYGPTHIPQEMSPEQVGRFIVTVNLSDLAAMGAKPMAFLLSYGGPDTEFKEFERMIKAADEQCRRFGMKLVGGDTKEMEELTLTGCAVGTARRPVFRSGAKAGDIVAVTGDLGVAGICFELLERNLKPCRALLRAALEPEPKIMEGLVLGGYANSMTDLSDGLALGLYSIAERSGAGMEIDVGRIPVSGHASRAGKRFGLDAVEHALYGGGDYQLLFTVPEEKFSRIGNLVKVTEIGMVKRAGGIRAKRNGRESKLKKEGYEHFRGISRGYIEDRLID